MSLVTRKGLEFIINQLGKARSAFSNLSGDLTSNPGYFLDFERTLVKLRGSTTFHDYDLSRKNNLGVNQKPYLSFNSPDNIFFGIQGANLNINDKVSGFGNTGGWNPVNYNPPALEGWEALDYNAWSSYIPQYDANGNSNTSYIIYNINSEPGTGIARTAYNFPVRYSGTGYTQVPLFNSSRWVSVKNTSGSTSTDEVHLIVNKNYFEGVKNINPYNNCPIDLGIYGHVNLLTQGIGSTFSLAGSMSGVALTHLAYSISETNSSGSTSSKIKDHYLIKINLPDTTWTSNYWFHLGFYWSTHDTFFLNSYPTYASGTAMTFYPSGIGASWNVYNRKTYFQKNINSYVGFDKTGVNDSNIYLFSDNKTNVEYFDNDYSLIEKPFRYLLEETFTGSSTGDTNSVSNFKSIKSFEIIPVVICTKNFGISYEEGNSLLYIFTGDALPVESIPNDWDDFAYYPIVSEEYQIITKIIVSYSSFETSGINNKTSGYADSSSIIYIDQIADNFVVPPIGDLQIATYVLPSAIEYSQLSRSNDFNTFLGELSNLLLSNFSGFSKTRLARLIDFQNVKNFKLLHNLLKYPTNVLLKSNNVFNNIEGLASISSGTKNLIGKNTKFLSQITAGDYIYDSSGSNLIGKVDTVISNNQILLIDNSKFNLNDDKALFKNSILETEPYEVPATIDGVNAISNWASLPHTTIFSTYDENGLFVQNKKLIKNTEFEIYQQQTNLENINDHENNGNKLVRDYSYKFKFKDINYNSFIKTLLINSSKYFITDQEYQNRQSKKLSVNGYFKIGSEAEISNRQLGTLSSIEDYRLYGTSAIVPDLEMGTSRTIFSKVVEPVDSFKTTQADFINSLKLNNPSITQDEINKNIDAFELTQSFYTPNSNQMSNQYSSIEELGITVSSYRDDSNAYWIDNIQGLIGSTNQSSFYLPTNKNDIRCDSFVISGSGYSTTNNTINKIENIFDQQIEVSSSSGINQNTKNSYQSVNFSKFAIKITPVLTTDIKSFAVRIANTSAFNNPTAYIKCSIWDNVDGLPDSQLVAGSKVFYSELNNLFKNIYFYLNYKLIKNKTYWLVFESNTNPPEYDESTSGLVNVDNTLVTGIYNPLNDSYTNFENYLANSQIGFGSTAYSNISTWYSISSIASTTAMTISSTGSTLSNQNYVIKYDLRLQVSETTISNSDPENIALFDGFTWTLENGSPYIKFYKQDEDVYGAFNRNFKYSNLILPEPNDTRKNDKYKLDEYWSINCKNLSEPDYLYIYPRAIKHTVLETTGIGTNGNNFVTLTASNFSPKILVGLGISQNTYISSGTLVTSISYNSSSEVYNVYLSNNLTGSLGTTTLYFNDDSMSYCKRANDIHLYVKYVKNDTLTTKYIKLDKSPTWISKWYNKRQDNFNILDLSVESSIVSASHNLDFTEFSGSGQTRYINGNSTGSFITLSSIGSSFDFQLTSSGGVKLFINDEANPYIDQWANNSLSSYTCSYSATGSSQNIKLSVDFCNFENLQRLKAEFRISGTSTWYPVDSNFYLDSSISPTLIDEEKIQSLNFLSIGKTLDQINDQYYGFPVTDKLVIRNK